MRTSTLRAALAAALGTMGVVACTDGATAPGEVVRVAQLEQLATQAVAAGDLSGGERLRVVAKALQHGVRPSRYEAFTGERMEGYLALVLVEEHQGIEPYTHNRFDRFFFMWHEVDQDNLHLMQMKTTGEYGEMQPNASDPGAAEYMERRGALSHMSAFAGEGRINEVELGRPCENTPVGGQRHLVTCQRAIFRVGFELNLAHDAEVGAATHMKMWAQAQNVRGIKWTKYDPE